MKCIRLLILYMLFILLIAGCKTDPLLNFPELAFIDNRNHQFTFTNKIAGFYLGNSHKENQVGHNGWTVNDFHYLKDYRLVMQDVPVFRDSLEYFKYYPVSMKRQYLNGLSETFTLIDSINAIVWEFESPADLTTMQFIPILPQPIPEKDLILSENKTQLIFSPFELGDSQSESQTGWLGFKYITETKNRIVVLGVINKYEKLLNKSLENLARQYKTLILNRQKRIQDDIGRNELYTNIPELTDAITWAQISLDALITRQRGPGIWAGLPWFNNYRGRDTFISFAGALLVSGKFDEARNILKSFSDFQLKDEEDSWYGRIPNLVTNKEVIYNTTDVTWWFVREAYEYVLYSGDIAFALEIFPVIKRAIQGALRYRIDENFYLVHDDADTWMDAKGDKGAWSPRGNRSVEIQALWYTALQVGAQFAAINKDSQLKDHWLAISQRLKKNFIKDYWNSFRGLMADHLNSDGSKDKKIRPNQIFAVFVPQLPQIEPLVSQDISAQITSQVTSKLTYRYGVASLWQKDVDFHPWYHHLPIYVQDEAYHNGTIWTWLAGPVLSSLLSFHQDGLAFNLYYNQAFQILYDDAIGNFSELRDAIPRTGHAEPDLSGNVSQAWSLAEFSRNFYQDFVGYQPNALKGEILIRPVFPKEISTVSTCLPWKSNKIHFKYTAHETGYTIDISLTDYTDNIKGIFILPGYNPKNFVLNEDNPDIQIRFLKTEQRSFHRYTDLDWFFVQPEILEIN